jgi:hypothetical protein
VEGEENQDAEYYSSDHGGAGAPCMRAGAEQVSVRLRGFSPATFRARVLCREKSRDIIFSYIKQKKVGDIVRSRCFYFRH